MNSIQHIPTQSPPVLLGDTVAQALRSCSGFLGSYLFSSAENSNDHKSHLRQSNQKQFNNISSKTTSIQVSSDRSLLDLSLLAAPLLYSYELNEQRSPGVNPAQAFREILTNTILCYQSKNGGFSATKNPKYFIKLDAVLSCFSVLALIDLNQNNLKNVDTPISTAAKYIASLIKNTALSLSDVKLENLLVASTIAQASTCLKDYDLKKDVIQFLKPALYSKNKCRIKSHNKLVPKAIEGAILTRIFIDIGLMSNESAFIQQACLHTNDELPSLLRFTEGLRTEHKNYWFRKKSISVPYLAAWAVNLIRLGTLTDNPQNIDVGGDILRFLTDITTNSLTEYGTCLGDQVSLRGDPISHFPSPFAIRFYIEACLEAEIIFPKSIAITNHGGLKELSAFSIIKKNREPSQEYEKNTRLRLRA